MDQRSPKQFLSKRSSKKRWLLVAGAILVALIVAVALYFGSQGEQVLAVQMKRENVVATLTVTGEVDADTTVAFSPPVSARIRQVFVDEGDTIKPGQLLVELDREDALAAVSEAGARASQAEATLRQLEEGTRPEQIRLWEARVSESTAMIRQTEASLAAARERAQEAQREAARFRQLLAQGYATQQEAEQRQTEAEVTQREVNRLQAALNSARAQRRQNMAQLEEARKGPRATEIQEAAAAARAARATVGQASARLEDYQVYSQFNGVITERLQDPGELATPGQPILRAVNPQTLEITALVEENDLARVSVGDRVYVVLDAMPDTLLPATIRRVGSRVNPQNGTVEVEINLLPEAWGKLGGLKLLTGMTADVNIITDRLRNAMVLPVTAVRQEGGESLVYVFEDRRLKKRPVRLQRISVENYRVLSGLEPGEWVASVANPTLLEKKRVRPLKQEETLSKPKPPAGVKTP